ncbi:5'-methylthioadenosine/S-adenosylhomocysteine nucleosidase [Rhizobium sp. GR12]|uniref:5'-methylthioadenosine/S-adenosylhomocysteine nucleosidase n=1 Tax=Rhizobium sp. GR12 TaxID=3053925 RepID=UPI002FBD8491
MSYRLLHVADKSVLFVMAASAEYGPHLQARIAPLMTGVGPVEAAISVTAVLAGLDAADHLPDLVVSLGSAGSRTLEQTGVYQAISVSYRDMDASAFGFEKGRTPFLDLPAEVALPLRIPGLAEARLSTGANVISGEAYGLIDADMVEMETYAVLRACQRFGLPLVGLRGISDGKADVNHVDDWTEYLHIIDEKLADAIDRLCRAIADGAITL